MFWVSFSARVSGLCAWMNPLLFAVKTCCDAHDGVRCSCKRFSALGAILKWRIYPNMGSLLVSVTLMQHVNIWAKPPSSSVRMSFMDGVPSLYYLLVHAWEGIMREEVLTVLRRHKVDWGREVKCLPNCLRRGRQIEYPEWISWSMAGSKRALNLDQWIRFAARVLSILYWVTKWTLQLG